MLFSEFKNILAFTRSVLNQVVILVTGGVTTAGVAVWEHFAGKSVSRDVYTDLVGGFLIMALYRSWLDERNKRAALEIAFGKPKVSGEIIGIGIASGFESANSNVFLHLRLVNESPAPVTLTGFALRVVLSGMPRTTETLGSLQNWQLVGKDIDQVGFRSLQRISYLNMDDLAQRVRVRPLERGVSVEGWIRFCPPFSGVEDAEQVALILKDALGYEHLVKSKERIGRLYNVEPKYAPIVVSRVARTCLACPSQFEGVTKEGKFVYAKYRSGCLQVSIGNTEDEAAFNVGNVVERRMDEKGDDSLRYEELCRATLGVVDWPSECPDMNRGPGWRTL